MKSTVETKICELVKRGHLLSSEVSDENTEILRSSVAAMLSDLASQLEVQLVRSNALAAENAGLNKFIAESCFVQAGEIPSWHQAIDHAPETPTTSAFLAEVRAHDINAFIQHHSAELDAHIKNGGEQFDEKSVRIRNIIVSARLFREQLRKGVQS
ncbi:hypothetical protein [Citrobacter koseri]|uniref:hypothetical protein n=1 Tax=Citrobacter koseri TaxID=545 RepID=UPI001F3F43C3|nr:hypothetical protein [Citrobacter koseri]